MRIDLDMTLEEIIMVGRGESLHEPMDGDEVDSLIEYVKEVVNNHEGNTDMDAPKGMRAIFIDSTKETVEEITFEGDFQDIQKILGVDCFTCVQLDEDQNTLYVDDEGLFKEDVGYFLIEGKAMESHPYPLAGNGLILGTNFDTGESVSTRLPLPRVTFMDREELQAKYA